jgi:hypothetical protein
MSHIMTPFSNYIDSVLAAISAISTCMPASTEPGPTEVRPPHEGQAFKIQSMELTIPMIVHAPSVPPGALMAYPISAWLCQQTHHELTRLLPLLQQKSAPNSLLPKTIHTCAYTLQSLLHQSEVALDQVFQDYAQAVLAVAWDECHADDHDIAPVDASAMPPSFEQVTSILVAALRQGYEQRRAIPAQPVEVTVEPQNLREFPAHALTYLKLWISGAPGDRLDMDLAPA